MSKSSLLWLLLGLSVASVAAPQRRGRKPPPSSRRRAAPLNTVPVVSDEALAAEDAKAEAKGAKGVAPKAGPEKSPVAVAPAPVAPASPAPVESAPAPEPAVPTAPELTVTSREVTFVSKRAWSAPRWFVLGRWNSPREIQWPGGVKISLRFASNRCALGPELGTLERRGKNTNELELLSAGPWFAIEVSPDVANEELEAVLPATPEGQACRSRVPVAYAWNSEKGQRDPVLFLSSTGNEFYNRIFHVSTPARSERADLQLEVLLGAWRGQFPNAVGASKSFFLAPTAVTRGEWLLPVWRKVFGLQISLEQNVSNLGAGTDQNVLFSDWTAGAFYQRYFPWLDGFHGRVSVRYHQHTAEDNKKSLTLADAGRDASHLMLGLGATSYFGRAWLAGADIDFSLPSSVMGKEGSSMIDFTVRGGRRLTGSLYWVLELGYRVQGIAGSASEGLLKTQTGIRLDL